MADYQKMYTTLCNAITDALAQLARQNVGEARELLEKAQQTTEEMYVEGE